MRKEILLDHYYVENNYECGKKRLDSSLLGTVLSNLSYYGYVPSESLFRSISFLTESGVKEFWEELEPALKEVTGDSKKMDKFVVYKNFPKEVLKMSEAEYWIKQILMYLGLPNEMVTEEEIPRDKMMEKRDMKVLFLADENTFQKIADGIASCQVRWIHKQRDQLIYLYEEVGVNVYEEKITFKENLVAFISHLINSGLEYRVRTATDVMRLAIGLSGGDISGREKTKFRSFSRKERKFMLSMLEDCHNLQEDMARNKGKWKRFMYCLHPNDYRDQFPKTCNANDKLYKGDLNSFNAIVEVGIKDGDKSVLLKLSSRPGDYARRLNKLIQVFDDEAVSCFVDNVIPKLGTQKLLKMEKYLETINSRAKRIFPPKGNWNKAQIADNEVSIDERHLGYMLSAIRDKVSENVQAVTGPVILDRACENIKIQGSDADLTPYGRGTKFKIPDNVKFIRTASYWEFSAPYHSIWYDNGFNFFDDNWAHRGACCWDSTNGTEGAVFSGDPTNWKDELGRACQMIDLYPEKLLSNGIRYCVWNLLCYSHKSFDEAEEVYAALQWGESPQKGNLFEPSRCQLSFPVKGKNYTKYIAYIDLEKREVVYMDANFKASVRSASNNGAYLEEMMPAFLEYLETQPSVFDVFKGVERDEKSGTIIAYSDDNLKIEKEKAYVFIPKNKDNEYEQINISEVIGGKS